jgi:hypothetical protein
LTESDINSFTLRFSDKAEWNNFKEDLKSIFRENQIKYQYSEQSPTFHIVYKSSDIHVRIFWKDEILIVNLKTSTSINSEVREVCNAIYDLLLLFGGELQEGTSPYDW